jgi:hypothetical protein
MLLSSESENIVGAIPVPPNPKHRGDAGNPVLFWAKLG